MQPRAVPKPRTKTQPGPDSSHFLAVKGDLETIRRLPGVRSAVPFPIPEPALTGGRVFSGRVAVIADSWYQAKTALDRPGTVAHAAGKDPYLYRRELLARTTLPYKNDMIKALDMAAEMSGWGTPLDRCGVISLFPLVQPRARRA